MGKCFPNNKPLVTEELQPFLKEAVFRPVDREADRRVQRQLCVNIKEEKDC